MIPTTLLCEEGFPESTWISLNACILYPRILVMTLT